MTPAEELLRLCDEAVRMNDTSYSRRRHPARVLSLRLAAALKVMVGFADNEARFNDQREMFRDLLREAAEAAKEKR